MKIYDIINNQYAVCYCDNGCFVQDISRDDAEYKTIEIRRTLTMDDLKQMAQNDDCSVYDVIASNSDNAEEIGIVTEYAAENEDGEKFSIFVVDIWD